jgi:L-ribulose-5-phosphate 4-epimerase
VSVPVDTALPELRAEVLAANLALPARGLVTLTWGNASAVDRERGLVVIKPSGVSYESLTAEDLVVLELDGTIVSGDRRPSTDAPTHLALYRAYPEIGAVVHTHSTWATVWAQSGRDIPLLGTTHADLSPHPIPVSRGLTVEEVEDDYEGATGTVLIETLARFGPDQVPAVLVRGHAPFCWGRDASAAVEHAVALEQVAQMALFTRLLEREGPLLDLHVRDKHYARKHGPDAYYGQR